MVREGLRVLLEAQPGIEVVGEAATGYQAAREAARLRPDVVWFGEGLSRSALEDAAGCLESADVVWVVGTSSVVYPAASLPEIAARRGSVTVEVNPVATPLSSRVDHRFAEPASKGLPALVEVCLRPRVDGEIASD